MARIKSLLIQIEISYAGKSHNCQANSRHRIAKDEIRLGVRNGRGWDYYCQECAKTILAKDIEKISQLQQMFIPTD